MSKIKTFQDLLEEQERIERAEQEKRLADYAAYQERLAAFQAGEIAKGQAALAAYFSIASSAMGMFTHSMGSPQASTTRSAASVISGPMPLPFKTPIFMTKTPFRSGEQNFKRFHYQKERAPEQISKPYESGIQFRYRERGPKSFSARGSFAIMIYSERRRRA